MLPWKSTLAVLALAVLTSPDPAIAQHEALALDPVHRISLLAPADSITKDLSYEKIWRDECDPVVDGTILGGLIGGSPAIVGLILAGLDETDGERYIPVVYAGILGGIAGSIIGLGIDSADCDTMSHVGARSNSIVASTGTEP